MPTIEELLRNSLNGANEKYDQANRDLHQAVAELGQAVQSVSNGKAKLALFPETRTTDGTNYSFRIRFADNSQDRELGKFVVTTKGYPIQAQGLKDGSNSIDSGEELRTIFQRLASESDSPLVGYLAYIVRNRQTNDEAAPVSG